MTDETPEIPVGLGEARIAALEPPYDPETEAMLARWMPPGSGVEPLALFRTLGRHEELASRSRPLGAGILGKGLVPPRLREVMIHRTCALTGAEYEWGVHVMGFGRPLGFTDEQIIELCITSGWYHAISYVINVAEIPLEPWATRFEDLEDGAGES